MIGIRGATGEVPGSVTPTQSFSSTVKVPAWSQTWQAWGALLVILYLASTWATWGRTLIATEVWALYFAEKPFAEHMNAVRQDLVHPPLMYLVHRAWITAFGSSDNAVKALPIAINIPALLLFTLLAKRTTKHWQVVSLLFCSVYLAARVPATTRMYGLGLLLAVAAMLLWKRWRAQPSTGRLVQWSAVMLLLEYTHLFGFLLLAGFTAAVCITGPRRRAFLTAAVAVGLAYIPWVLYILPVYQERGIETNLWWVEMLFGNPIRALLLLPAGLLGDLPINRWPSAVFLAGLVVHLALVVVAVRYGGRRLWPPRSDATAEGSIWPMLMLTSVPVALLFAFSVLRTPALHMRFLLGIYPAYWLLIGLLTELGGRFGRLLLYSIVVPWALGSVAASFALAVRNPGLRAAAEQVASAERAGDRKLCARDCNQLFWEWTHRLGRTTPIEFVQTEESAPRTSVRGRALQQSNRLSVQQEVSLPQITIDDGQRVWIITSGREELAAISARLDVLGYRPEFESRAHRMFVRRFVQKDEPDATRIPRT